MDNKLSELSKPVGFVSDRASTQLKEGDPASIRPFFDVQGSKPLYSQEYVSALLAELEAKDKRIAELERANKSQDDHINQQQDRIDSLEKKNAGLGRGLSAAEKRLATPVRLPDAYQTSCSESEKYLCPVEVAEAIRAVGFTVDGDE